MDIQYDPVKAASILKKHGISFADAEGVLMKAEYDFSKGKRSAVVAQKGKTRITIYIDNAVLDEFRTRAEHAGTGYQTMMNEALKVFLEKREQPVTEEILRQVIREELPDYRPAKRSAAVRKKRSTGKLDR